MEKVSYSCAQCHVTVVRYPSRAGKYCSKECGWAAQRADAGPKSKPCAACGVPIVEMYASGLAERKYCSQACNGVGRSTRVERNCVNCGKTMKVIPANLGRTKTCSRSCAGSLRMANRVQKFPARQSKQAASAVSLYLSGQYWLPAVATLEYAIGPYSIDLAFVDLKLAVELDGWFWHSKPDVVMRDQRKNRYLLDRGWSVLRITMGRSEDPDLIAARIAAAVIINQKEMAS